MSPFHREELSTKAKFRDPSFKVKSSEESAFLKEELVLESDEMFILGDEGVSGCCVKIACRLSSELEFKQKMFKRWTKHPHSPPTAPLVSEKTFSSCFLRNFSREEK